MRTPDRSQILGLVLYIVPIAIALPVKFLAPGTITQYAPILFAGLTLPLDGYASYWAFGIGRLLPSKIYRRQALAAGFLALTLWLSGIGTIVLGNSPNLQLSLGVTFLAFCSPLFIFFYFTDETIRAARRSDPLFRDILRWSKVRIPLWIILVITLGTLLVVVGYATVTDDVSALNAMNNGTYGGVLFSIDSNYLISLAFIGVIWLAAAALRAKWDRNLRRNFLWLAVAIGLYFLLANISAAGAFIVLFQSMGFALYMAARSLSPVNRVQTVRQPQDDGKAAIKDLMTPAA